MRAALAIAGTLAQAHSRGIIHGGLKPECLRTGDSGEVRITGFQGAATSPAQLRESATADVAAFLHCAGVLLGPSGGPPPRLRGVFEGRVVLSADDPLQAMAALRDELRESLEDTFPWPIPGWERPPGKPAPVVQRADQGGAPRRQAAPTPPTALAPPIQASVTAAPVVAVPAVAAPTVAPPVMAAPVVAAPAVAHPATAAPASPVAHPPKVLPPPPVVAVVEAAATPALQSASQPASTPPSKPGQSGAPMVQAAVARAVMQALESAGDRPATPLVPAASRKPSRVAVQGAATAGPRRQSAWLSGPAAWLCVGLLASAATLWVLDSIYGIADASNTAPTATPAAPEASLQAGPAAGAPRPQGEAEIESAVSAAIADGFARLEAGQPDLARAWFEHALTLQPNNPRALAGQGQAAAAMESSSLGRVSRLLDQSATTQR